MITRRDIKNAMIAENKAGNIEGEAFATVLALEATEQKLTAKLQKIREEILVAIEKNAQTRSDYQELISLRRRLLCAFSNQELPDGDTAQKQGFESYVIDEIIDSIENKK